MPKVNVPVLSCLTKICVVLLHAAGLVSHVSAEEHRSSAISMVLANQADELATLLRAQPSILDGGELTAQLLHHAATHADGTMIELLLDAGIDIDSPGRLNYTPLMAALEAANAETAYILKLRGADLGATGADGMMPMDLAELAGLKGFDAPAGALSTHQPLDREEADLVLLLAAELGDADTIRLALASGADPTQRAPNNWSPLMLTALGSHLEALEVIVEALKLKGEDVVREDIARSLTETGLDPVVAALTGRGGDTNDIHRAQRTVAYLLAEVLAISSTDTLMEYQNMAFRLGYPSLLPSRDNWGVVQGLSIDSQPAETTGSSPAAGTVQGLSLDTPAPAPDRDLSTPSGFLPSLEYGLPISGQSNEAGWRSVQRILYDEGGLYTGALTGRLDDATLMALLAYLEPLMQLLESRIREAEIRADEEDGLQTTASTPIRYGISRRPDGEWQYRGELHFIADGKVRPAGYATPRAGPSGYFLTDEDSDQPLCSFRRNEAASNLRILDCRILDGHLNFSDSDSFVTIGFRRGNDQFEHLIINK